MEVQFMNLQEDAKFLINEISFAVKSISISSVLPQSNLVVYLNIETKESDLFTIRLTPQGFQVVSHGLDRDDNGSAKYPSLYETIYSLLQSISKSYVTIFGNALSEKLNALRELQEKDVD